MKADGYMVFEFCGDYEQALRLCIDAHTPESGILDWAVNKPAAIFRTRAEARAAIERTHHYALAYDLDTLPERRACKVVPVRWVKSGEPQ